MNTRGAQEYREEHEAEGFESSEDDVEQGVELVASEPRRRPPPPPPRRRADDAHLDDDEEGEEESEVGEVRDLSGEWSQDPVASEEPETPSNQTRSGTVEEALKFAGGFGRWHWEHFLLVSAAWFCCSLALWWRPAVDEDQYGSRGYMLHSFQAAGAILGCAVWGYSADRYGVPSPHPVEP